MREIAIRGFINEKYNTPFGKGLFRRAIYNGSVELLNPNQKYLVDFYEYEQFQHTAKSDQQIRTLKKFDCVFQASVTTHFRQMTGHFRVSVTTCFRISVT
ncbi:hypothetical protein M2125_001375, partial [Polynucleobacter sphagniphilus]|uniref:hypothetical protein n=1 Tax=Polynucleobacter sphagniphilus TaxID=1743169 RepID=UPI002476F4BD